VKILQNFIIIIVIIIVMIIKLNGKTQRRARTLNYADMKE